MNGMFFSPAGTGMGFELPVQKQPTVKVRKRQKPVNTNTEQLQELGALGMDDYQPTVGLMTDYKPSEDDAQPTTTVPTPTGGEPRKDKSDNWFSKFIRPAEDELEAERNGRRWNWQLENRFMLPGSKYAELVMAAADRENAIQRNMLKVQSNLGSAREHANAKASWDKFVSDIYNGNWDNAGKTLEEARDFERQFKQWYAGMGWDPADLRPIGTSVGKINNATRKAMTDMAADLSDTEQFMTDIAQWSKDGSWQDPIKSAMIKDYLDKVSQKLSATLGGDSKSMADAEKIRIQILYLPEESMKLVQEEVRNYREWLSKVMAYGSAKGWSQDVLGRINQAKGSLANALKTGNQGNISTMLGQAMSYVGSALGGIEKNSELALDIQTVLGAGVQQHKDFMNDMVLAADVDPARVFLLAKQLHDLTLNRYNNEARRSNRNNDMWQSKEIEQPSLQYLHKVVKASPFLKPNKYYAPAVEYAKKDKNTPNPQSKGEHQAKGGFAL
jgi:hypothetical protein